MAMAMASKTARSSLIDPSKVAARLKQLEGDLKGENDNVPWIKTKVADMIFGMFIIANGLFMGIAIEWGGEGFTLWVWITDSVFLAVFIVELLLRMRAERAHFWNYFDRWGVFDLVVTIMSVVDTWVMTLVNEKQDSSFKSVKVLRILRLVRLVRLIRVLRMFSELSILVTTIIKSMRAVGWLSLLLFMVIYVGSVFVVMMLGQPYAASDPEVDERFGSLARCMYTHFQIATLEDWGSVCLCAMRYNRLWGLYWVVVIVLTNFCLVNLMVGVIVERIMHVANEQDQQMSAFVAESEQFRTTMQAVFNGADVDLSGDISREEIQELLDSPKTSEIMSAFSINLNVPTEVLHRIMNVNGGGTTNFEDFLDACIRLCGSKGNVHSVFVQNDICDTRQQIEKSKARVEDILFGPPVRPVRATAEAAGRPYRKPTGAKDQLTEIMDRMERLGQVQQQIFSEVKGLKETTRPSSRASGSGFPRSKGFPDPSEKSAWSRSSGPRLRAGEAVAVLLDKAGTEIGNCCVDSLLNHRRVGSEAKRVRSQSEGPRNAPEAEFLAQAWRSRQAPEAPPWL